MFYKPLKMEIKCLFKKHIIIDLLLLFDKKKCKSFTIKNKREVLAKPQRPPKLENILAFAKNCIEDSD
jgi:hypothetical protein